MNDRKWGRSSHYVCLCFLSGEKTSVFYITEPLNLFQSFPLFLKIFLLKEVIVLAMSHSQLPPNSALEPGLLYDEIKRLQFTLLV
jgi:hypothetical protein